MDYSIILPVQPVAIDDNSRKRGFGEQSKPQHSFLSFVQKLAATVEPALHPAQPDSGSSKLPTLLPDYPMMSVRSLPIKVVNAADDSSSMARVYWPAR